MLFHDPASDRAYVVWHAFTEPGTTFEIALPAGRDWRVNRDWSDMVGQSSIQAGNRLQISRLRAFSGGVVVLG